MPDRLVDALSLNCRRSIWSDDVCTKRPCPFRVLNGLVDVGQGMRMYSDLAGVQAASVSHHDQLSGRLAVTHEGAPDVYL